MPQGVISENIKLDNKENGGLGTCMVRSKLQRLGKLYSGKQNNEINILTWSLSHGPHGCRYIRFTLNFIIYIYY